MRGMQWNSMELSKLLHYWPCTWHSCECHTAPKDGVLGRSTKNYIENVPASCSEMAQAIALMSSSGACTFAGRCKLIKEFGNAFVRVSLTYVQYHVP